MMLDTQVLSDAYKGRDEPVQGARISSIVAGEFLEIYLPTSFAKARYYIRYHSGHTMAHDILGGELPPSTRKPSYIDRLILEFGRDYPTVIEYGSRAMAAIINDRNHGMYAQIVGSFDKAFQKKVRPRFAFICGQIGQCVPLTRETAEVGMYLFGAFTRKYAVKDDFRNSINDMMIIATARSSGERLISKDSLLNRFAADVFGVSAGSRPVVI